MVMPCCSNSFVAKWPKSRFVYDRTPRSAWDASESAPPTSQTGKLPKGFAKELTSILNKPLLLYSTIPPLSTYAEFSNQVEDSVL